MDSSTFFTPSNITAAIVAVIFIYFQLKYFNKTKKYRALFNDFFKKNGPYTKENVLVGTETYPQLTEVGPEKSDLNALIKEINNYVVKTKGTTDFALIQNRVERKLNMRYDQSVTHLSFPTYLGLMGTFAGVFLGILMFNKGFDSAGNISDDSIKSLLTGVLVSMFTSLFGLLLTTINNAKAGNARQKIEEDKNEFYDYIQTELMPTLNVSLVAAIGKLHDTVDRFEPSFDRVINRFQTTFDNCTAAFGQNFERNVVAVAGAVEAMGQNMDKINENIQYQKELIQTMKSDEVAKGMDRYIEAAHQFVSITQSLNKFEEARRMMLAAAQEAINIQNAYADSLKIPREVAVRINQILDRIKEFENSVNAVGGQLSKREILGNEVVNKIQEQIAAIGKKQKIADRYLEKADGKLEDMFQAQTAVINSLSKKYEDAISAHIESFDKMLQGQTEELNSRHRLFMQAMEDRLSIEEIRKEFVNLGKLVDIDKKAEELDKKIAAFDKKFAEFAKEAITESDIRRSVASAVEPIKQELVGIKADLKKKEEEKSAGVFGGFFGNRR